jgi:predicted small lipoprotein YifL
VIKDMVRQKCLLAASLLVLCTLAGCGLKGSLYQTPPDEHTKQDKSAEQQNRAEAEQN